MDEGAEIIVAAFRCTSGGLVRALHLSLCL